MNKKKTIIVAPEQGTIMSDMVVFTGIMLLTLALTHKMMALTQTQFLLSHKEHLLYFAEESLSYAQAQGGNFVDWPKLPGKEWSRAWNIHSETAQCKTIHVRIYGPHQLCFQLQQRMCTPIADNKRPP